MKSALLNLDTHIVVSLLKGTLTKREIQLIEDAPLAISDIVLWEIAKLHQLGRIRIDLNHPEIQRFIAAIKVIPIDALIAKASTQLDIKSDPADEVIAATSLVYQIPLVTRDAKIRKSKLIEILPE